MTKSTVTRIFIGSLFAIAGGVVLLVAGLFLALVNGTFIMRGPDVVGVQASALTWSMAGLAVVGILAIVGGALGQFIAWIGAVLNTARLDDKIWFIVLLVLGLLSFGFIAMLVYVIAGPDGSRRSSGQAQPSGAPA
ncbi:MAG: hypothetical protein QOF49_269 [Chloroflexota bacterium]|jgi:hypothetical protein|nr:hypothetical protein [Chloroflexota bacterium]